MSLVTGNDCSTLQCYEEFKDSETVDLLSFEEACYRSNKPSKSGVLVTFTAKKMLCYMESTHIQSHMFVSLLLPKDSSGKGIFGPRGEGEYITL